jgi:hypothetical protein
MMRPKQGEERAENVKQKPTSEEAYLARSRDSERVWFSTIDKLMKQVTSSLLDFQSIEIKRASGSKERMISTKRLLVFLNSRIPQFCNAVLSVGPAFWVKSFQKCILKKALCRGGYTFKEFSLAHPDGNYFLRPDRILGAFHVDSSAPPVLVSIETLSELIVEKNRELKVNESLHLADSKQRSNTVRIDRSIGSIWAVDEVKAMMEKSMKEFSIIGDEENVVKVQKKNKDNMAAAFGPMEGGDIEMNTVIRTDKTILKSEEDRGRSNQIVSTSPLIHVVNSFG